MRCARLNSSAHCWIYWYFYRRHALRNFADQHGACLAAQRPNQGAFRLLICSFSFPWFFARKPAGSDDMDANPDHEHDRSGGQVWLFRRRKHCESPWFHAASCLWWFATTTRTHHCWIRREGSSQPTERRTSPEPPVLSGNDFYLLTHW